MASMGSFAVVIAGSPCAGKTTLAAAMATQLRAVLIDKDTVEWPLANEALAAAGDLPLRSRDQPGLPAARRWCWCWCWWFLWYCSSRLPAEAHPQLLPLPLPLLLLLLLR
jgi:hypothetical protein